MLQVMMVALACSLTSVSATNVQQSQMHASHYPLYSGQAFNPVAFPLMLSPASSPQSSIREGVLRSKGLDFLDLILLKQLTSRVNQLEEKVKSLTISNNELEGTVNNLTISNCQLEDTVKNLTSSNGQGGSGQPTSIGGMPTSCDDLRTLGNVMSGFYNIKSSTKVATVFCDFTKQSTDADFQQVIGNADVKSTAVYFYVKLANDVTGLLDKIPFEVVILNVGNSMDATSGTFTAPVDGTYFFSFSGAIVYYGNHPDLLVSYVVSMRVNEVVVAEGVTDETGIKNAQYNPVHLEATLNLKKGDTVYLLSNGDPEIIKILSRGLTSFSGILLSEENFP